MKPCRKRGALVKPLSVAYKVWGVTLTGVVFENVALRISENGGKGCGGTFKGPATPPHRRRFWKASDPLGKLIPIPPRPFYKQLKDEI
jgi:hypothetical protein